MERNIHSFLNRFIFYYNYKIILHIQTVFKWSKRPEQKNGIDSLPLSGTPKILSEN